MRGHELPVPERIDAPQHAVRGVPEPLRNPQLRRARFKIYGHDQTRAFRYSQGKA